jgi:hypothetical protein
MQAKLDEEAGRLVQLRQNIEQGWAGRALIGGAHHRARDVQRRIVDDARAGESAFIPFVSFGDLDNNTFKGLTSLLSVEQEIQYDEHT